VADSRDSEHFAERARREREAAARAADPAAAAMHRELAERYGAVAEAFARLDRTKAGQG
jgi:hypothetical protein